MTQLRRLIDLPGVADLEGKALMKPGYADPLRRDEFPEVDACLTELFGLTGAEAEAAQRPEDWDGIERLSPREQADFFEAEGWDVCDAKGRPLRMLGVAGRLPEAPFVPEPSETRDAWGSGLAAEAARFRKR
jgi:hypothetical protein